MTGDELKERRGQMGFSQQDLARELDVSLSTVARWEQLRGNEIPNSKLLELALKTVEGQYTKGGKK